MSYVNYREGDQGRQENEPHLGVAKARADNPGVHSVESWDYGQQFRGYIALNSSRCFNGTSRANF